MTTLVWIFLALMALSIIGTIVLLFVVFETGRSVGSFKKALLNKATTRDDRFLHNARLEKHVTWVDRFLVTSLLSVIFIEGTIRIIYGFGGGVTRLLDTTNGQVHLWADIAYATCLLCMRYWITGKKSRKWHRILFFGVVISYSIVTVTGTILVVGLVGKAMA